MVLFTCTFVGSGRGVGCSSFFLKNGTSAIYLRFYAVFPVSILAHALLQRPQLRTVATATACSPLLHTFHMLLPRHDELSGNGFGDAAAPHVARCGHGNSVFHMLRTFHMLLRPRCSVHSCVLLPRQQRVLHAASLPRRIVRQRFRPHCRAACATLQSIAKR